MTSASIFLPFTDQGTIALTSFRNDGTPVSTAVNIAVVDGGHALVRTFASSGKAKRIRRNHHVTIAPSTISGRATGPAIPATATFISGERADLAKRMISRKHPLLHGLLVPLAHRLQKVETVYMELTPDGDASQVAV
jgi:PPOX class probable F420-dependent enzyme